jgi:hypothetical protein
VPVSASFDISGTSVPEPGALALLLAAGLGALGCVWRRRS